MFNIGRVGDICGGKSPSLVPAFNEEILTVAQIVQGLMGVLVILSLVYKRHKESPKRPWGIWCVCLFRSHTTSLTGMLARLLSTVLHA